MIKFCFQIWHLRFVSLLVLRLTIRKPKMSTNPNQVAINMTELAITTSIVETDGRHNNQHTEESDGHISHPSRNENRRNGHDIRSFDDGSKTDANDEGDSDQSHRNHLSRSTSRERHHSRSSAVSGRTRRDVASATPEVRLNLNLFCFFLNSQ